MSRKLFCLLLTATIFLIINSEILNKKSWDCSNPSHSCSVGTTCCQSEDAPFGFYCLQGEDQKCSIDKNNSLKFLGERTEELNFKKNLNSINISLLNKYNKKIEKNSVVMLQQIVQGFFQGFPLLSSATSDNMCIDNEEFLNEALKLLNKVTDLDFNDPEAKTKAYKIVDRIFEKKSIFNREIKECEILEHNIKPALHEMEKILTKKGYYDRFAINLIGSLKKIGQIVNLISKANQKENYIEIGRKMGELIKLVFFWDL